MKLYYKDAALITIFIAEVAASQLKCGRYGRDGRALTDHTNVWFNKAYLKISVFVARFERLEAVSSKHMGPYGAFFFDAP